MNPEAVLASCVFPVPGFGPSGHVIPEDFIRDRLGDAFKLACVENGIEKWCVKRRAK